VEPARPFFSVWGTHSQRSRKRGGRRVFREVVKLDLHVVSEKVNRRGGGTLAFRPRRGLSESCSQRLKAGTFDDFGKRPELRDGFPDPPNDQTIVFRRSNIQRDTKRKSAKPLCRQGAYTCTCARGRAPKGSWDNVAGVSWPGGARGAQRACGPFSHGTKGDKIDVTEGRRLAQRPSSICTVGVFAG